MTRPWIEFISNFAASKMDPVTPSRGSTGDKEEVAPSRDPLNDQGKSALEASRLRSAQSGAEMVRRNNLSGDVVIAENPRQRGEHHDRPISPKALPAHLFTNQKRDLSEHVTDSDNGSYFQETRICEGIIGAGVILFLTSIVVLAVLLAFTAYVKEEREPETYVVQSGYVQVDLGKPEP